MQAQGRRIQVSVYLQQPELLLDTFQALVQIADEACQRRVLAYRKGLFLGLVLVGLF